MMVSDGVLPAPLSACRAGSQQGPLPCLWGDRTGGAGAGSVHWGHVWYLGGCQGEGTGTNREGEGQKPLRVLVLLPFLHPTHFPCGAGDGCVRGFSPCRSCPADSEKESGCSVFTSHLNIHESCELPSYVTQARLGHLPGAPPHSSSSLAAVKEKINSTSCFGDNSFIQIAFEIWQVLGVLFAESTQGLSGTGSHLKPGF